MIKLINILIIGFAIIALVKSDYTFLLGQSNGQLVSPNLYWTLRMSSSTNMLAVVGQAMEIGSLVYSHLGTSSTYRDVYNLNNQTFNASVVVWSDSFDSSHRFDQALYVRTSFSWGWFLPNCLGIGITNTGVLQCFKIDGIHDFTVILWFPGGNPPFTTPILTYETNTLDEPLLLSPYLDFGTISNCSESRLKLESRTFSNNRSEQMSLVEHYTLRTTMTKEMSVKSGTTSSSTYGYSINLKESASSMFSSVEVDTGFSFSATISHEMETSSGLTTTNETITTYDIAIEVPPLSIVTLEYGKVTSICNKIYNYPISTCSYFLNRCFYVNTIQLLYQRVRIDNYFALF
jgi:hypothetical protein